jgi:Fe-S-cluster containining protein
MHDPAHTFPPEDLAQTNAWRALAARSDVAEAIDAVHDDIARAIAQRGPVCWASGRCCRFDTFGHRLYVTGLETALVLRRVVPAQAPSAGALPQLRSAPQRDACVFVSDNLCSIHPQRPMGCRIFFCDRTAQAWQHELYEHAQERIRLLHRRFDAVYRYAEWRYMLALLGADALT